MRKTILIALGAAVALVDCRRWRTPPTRLGRECRHRHIRDDKVAPFAPASCTGADSKAFTVTMRPLHRHC